MVNIMSCGWEELGLRLLLAALLGALIGLERDIHGRAAGLRTNLLVSLGSALFMIISAMVAAEAIAGSNSSRFADPGRIAAQIVTGIGFLGAGAIIKEGFTIRGLTTAACLWLVAGVGMACGAGYYVLAALVSGIALFSLVGFKNFDRFYPRDSYRTLSIETSNEVILGEIVKTIKGIEHLKILYFDFDRDFQTGITKTTVSIRIFHTGSTDKIAHSILDTFRQSGLPIRNIKWDHRQI
ncbi:MAG: hypothetical protein A2X49_04730 [Lentisphaerae bacterium GWF2_52_8]|nr:MAG: hypothetical protein A2X49_04730 [Lentisphaerae bacterium GWF2_52_8]